MVADATAVVVTTRTPGSADTAVHLYLATEKVHLFDQPVHIHWACWRIQQMLEA